MATSIIVDGNQLGSVGIGQFFFDDEAPDREVFKEQARNTDLTKRNILKLSIVSLSIRERQ